MFKNRTITSSLLVVGGRFTSRIIDLIALLFLTRLLLPSDFGKVAIAISLVSLIDASLEFPINQAILSLRDATRAHYDTALTLSISRGLLLFIIANALAYPYAVFFDQLQIQSLILGLSLASLIRTCTNPALAFYQRHLIFWRDVGVELSGKVTYLILTICAALYFESYWALIFGTLAASTANVVASYYLAPFRPKVSFKEFHFFRSYIGSIAFAQVISTFNWQSEKMLLGKFYSDSQLGIYSTANDIAQMPIIAVLNPILRPLLAAFAREKDDKAKLAVLYKNTSSAILVVALPILIGICLVAENIISSLFDDKWHEAIPLLELLTLSMLPGPFAIAVVPLSLAYGRSKTFLYRSIIECCFKIPLMVCGLIYFGFYGVIFARIVSEFAIIVYAFIVVKEILRIRFLDQMLCGWPAILSSSAMVPFVLTSKYLFLNAGWPINSLVFLFFQVFIGALSYIICLIFTWKVFGLGDSPVAVFVLSVIYKVQRALRISNNSKL